jgi:hypothetical protein
VPFQALSHSDGGDYDICFINRLAKLQGQLLVPAFAFAFTPESFCHGE